MKAAVLKASNSSYKKYVEVNTIEDIFKINNIVVLEKINSLTAYPRYCNVKKDCDMVILIYDDYIE